MRICTQLMRLVRLLITLVLLQASLTHSISLNTNSDQSLEHASSLVAKNIFAQYTGDQPGGIPGILPGYGTATGYYWWVGGGLFGAMVQYWASTGDTTYNDATKRAIVYQSAPSQGGYFEPVAQNAQLGNDDISFWAFSALEAAEYKFPNPAPHLPQWLEMVQAVFNRQAGRWDPVCGGGLRWQVFFANPGYDYKNSISNGCFFQIGARLGRFTGNHTYIEWSEKTFDWMWEKGLIRSNYTVIDGINATDCSWASNTEKWTYNAGVMLYGAAVMWNVTGSEKWKQHTQGFITAAKYFFLPDEQGNPVVTEVWCEPYDDCSTDATTFKGYLIRWMYATIKVAPWTADQINGMLQYSAPAAAQVCKENGTIAGLSCGLQWYKPFDNTLGIGQNMNALTAISNLLGLPYPVTLKNSITKGNASAGGGGTISILPGTGAGGNIAIDVTTADKAGAAIITILLAAFTLGGAWWMVK